MARPDESQFVRWSDESSHVDRRAALPEELGAQILKKEDIVTLRLLKHALKYRICGSNALHSFWELSLIQRHSHIGHEPSIGGRDTSVDRIGDCIPLRNEQDRAVTNIQMTTLRAIR